ncbi:MAG: hypothetical protein Q4B32_10470 [Clostridia bacterium]|nr:hypothetical protein [Clostridia bacterium]
MIKLFNGSNPPRTFLIKAGEGATMTIQPGKFYDVPDAYLRDVTLRVALSCGDLQQFENSKQGGALEKAAAEAKPRKTSAKASLTKED